MNLFESMALVYIGIQSPFLIWASYPIIKRAQWLASPKVVFASVSLVTGIFGYYYLYGHFLIAGGMILVGYFFLRWLRYGDVHSFIISVLSVIAIDQLWQISVHYYDWSKSLLDLEIGLTSAAWNFMAFPFIGYFILKAKGKPSLGDFSISVLLVAILSSLASLVWPLFAYLTVFPWFAFFLTFFESSMPEYPIARPISPQRP